MDNAILRLPQVVEKVQVPKSTLYKWMKKGCFPKPLILGTRSVGWTKNSIEEWLSSRPQRS
jgi:prophage regulatory protein